MRRIRLLLKDLLCRIVRLFCKPIIVFESVPVYSDNTLPVYNEFVKRGYEKKYRLVWYLDKSKCSFKKGQKIKCISIRETSRLTRWKNNIFFYSNVKAVITCNHFLLFPFSNKYTSFYLTHGIPLKHTRNYYTIPRSIDYCISPSKIAGKLLSYELNYRYDRIIPTGYPRNDAFAEEPIDLKDIFNWDYSKIIVWLPTFRQHKFSSTISNANAIPIIYDKENTKVLNHVLSESNILVVIKPHFAQDVSYIKDLELSNIVIINDETLKKSNITLYQLLNSSDGLLSDYSSVFYDYLLRDKPIGLIWEDIEEYKKNPGLYPKYEQFTKGTHKIYTIDDMLRFMDIISSGIDNLSKERAVLRDELHISTDGKNTTRVVDFIVDKANL